MSDVFWGGGSRKGDTGPAGPTGAPGALVYDSSGAVSAAKIWSGTVTTNSSGVWSVDYTAAGFVAPPVIQANCTATGTTAADMRNAKTTTKSTTAASGIVVAPALSVLGIISVSLVGAGVSVDVTAIGK